MKARRSRIAARKVQREGAVVDGRGNLLSLLSDPHLIGVNTQSIGIQLFFLFLRFAGAAFALWSILHLPSIVWFWMAPYKPLHSRFTMYDITSLLPSTVFHLVSPHRDNVAISVVCGCLDAAGLLGFMLTMWWFYYRVVPGLLEKKRQRSIMLSQFSVSISNLPRRIDGDYQAELVAHITNMVQHARVKHGLDVDPNPQQIVVECCLVRDYQGQLMAFKNVDALEQQLEITQDLSERQVVQDKLQRARQACKAPVCEKSERDVCGRAFVVLNSPESQAHLLNTYRFSRFALFRPFQRSLLRFHSHPLKIDHAPEPGDILWEHQDRNHCSAGVRQAFTFVATSFLFALCCLVLVSIRAVTVQAEKRMLMDCWKNTTTTVENWRSHLPLTSCDCADLGIPTVYWDASIRPYCEEFITDFTHVKLLMLAGVACVLASNNGIQMLLLKLRGFEKPLNLSGFYSTVALKIFLAQFTNTALLIILVHAVFFRPALDQLAAHYGSTESVENPARATGTFNLFGWDSSSYMSIAGTLIVMSVSQVFLPHMSRALLRLMSLAFRMLRTCYAKNQFDLNMRYLLPNFNISVRLAGLMNVTCVTLFYSAGVPIMSVCAALACFLMYWTDKFVLLRLSAMPPKYDRMVLTVFKPILPLACLLHATFAVRIFGDAEMFPRVHFTEKLNPLSPNYIFDGQENFFTTFLSCGMTCAAFPNFLLWNVIALYCLMKVLELIIGSPIRLFHVCPTVSELIDLRTRCGASENLVFYAPEVHPAYKRLIEQANRKPLENDDSKLRHQRNSLQIPEPIDGPNLARKSSSKQEYWRKSRSARNNLRKKTCGAITWEAAVEV